MLLPHSPFEEDCYFEGGFRNVLGTRNLGEILSQRDSIAMEMQVIIMITITITSIINVINIIINVENKSIKSSIFTENCL